MSYSIVDDLVDIEDPGTITFEDIDRAIKANYEYNITRKEFTIYEKSEIVDSAWDPIAAMHLHPRSHQLFVSRFLNPYTPFYRILLKWKTGTGKTLGALVISNNFIKEFNKEFRRKVIDSGRINKTTISEAGADTPFVFIIGFTKNAFVEELLKYPEFGYITIVEREELLRLKKISFTGSSADVTSYKNYFSMIRRRISSKVRGGFYRFYGYQEFVNRLFVSSSTTLVEIAAKVADEEDQASAIKDAIAEKIRTGEITINVRLMEQFDRSLLICDEIHNTYNTNIKNNYGVALQYILDSVPTLRAVLLSTTPINNSPTEIVDVLGYLLPADKKIKKKDLFDKNKRLLPGAKELIGALSYGRISFMTDGNPMYYPKVNMVGAPRTLIESVAGYNVIPYLTFIECDMSPLHEASYREFIKEQSKDTFVDEITSHIENKKEKNNGLPLKDVDADMASAEVFGNIKVPSNSHIIIDMVFPNPANDKIGIWKSGELKNICIAPADWKGLHGVEADCSSNIITFGGSWLKASNIGLYYSKGRQLLHYIDASFERSKKREQNNETGPGEKMMIYHERIRGAGVALLSSILRENGMVDEYSDPTDSTLCAVCGTEFIKHGKIHTFIPARFILCHSDIDRGRMMASIDKYNSPENAFGRYVRFLVGSRLIREGYDIKDTTELHVLSKPVHMSALIQLRGRVERHSSHTNLPEDRRHVTIYYYLSTCPGLVTPEEYRYAEKMAEYKVIQDIEISMHEYAIDGNINRAMIPLTKESLPTIGPLYYDTKWMGIKGRTTASAIDSYYIRGYGKYEVTMCISLIKRLFTLQPVWSYMDLWKKIQTPPFTVEERTDIIEERNFAVALRSLVYTGVSYENHELMELMGEKSEVIERAFINLIFNPNERYIWVNNQQHKIEHIGDFFILSPVSAGRSYVDIESYIRTTRVIAPLRVNLTEWHDKTIKAADYATKVIEFEKRMTGLLSNPKFESSELNIVFDYDFDFSRKYLRSIVEKVIDGVELVDEIANLHDTLLDLYIRVGAIIFIRDVYRYKGVVRQFRSDIFDKDGKPTINKNIPVGFIDGSGISLYDSPNWITVSKLSLNRVVTPAENNIIVGYYEMLKDGTKFKIRNPIHEVKRAAISSRTKIKTDIRNIERGIVCSTKSKEYLHNLASLLKIKSNNKIKGICENIADRLIELEMKEIVKGTDVKWFYFWFEDIPGYKYVADSIE